jgi:hypothetical protein
MTTPTSTETTPQDPAAESEYIRRAFKEVLPELGDLSGGLVATLKGSGIQLIPQRTNSNGWQVAMWGPLHGPMGAYRWGQTGRLEDALKSWRAAMRDLRRGLDSYPDLLLKR